MALPGQFGDELPFITAEELRQRVQQGTAPRIIDVREPFEFTEGHIPGAENFPLSSFMNTFRGLKKDEEIVLVCRSGNRSAMAQEFLARQGYSQVINMIEGMLGWFGPTE